MTPSTTTTTATTTSQRSLPSSSTGLILSNTTTIKSFLISDTQIPQNLQQSALLLSTQSSFPYQTLRSIWVSCNPTTRPSLSLLLKGSSFLFTSPQPRVKSEELKERLKKLEELAERKAYAELVKDITPKKTPEEPFSSYKDQLGFGLHVAVTMFTGYLVGYIAFRALFGRNPVMSAAGGIVGLVCAMLVETLLFIIRTSDYNEAATASTPSSNSKLKMKKNQ